MIASIDGFIADGHGNVNPETRWDEEMQRFYVDLFTNVDAVVYGRRIFEQYLGHWGQPALKRSDLGYPTYLCRIWGQRKFSESLLFYAENHGS
jgi:dihydrofolate reductase